MTQDLTYPFSHDNIPYEALLKDEIHTSVTRALYEDLGGLSAADGDITAQLIPEENQLSAKLITREACYFVGVAWVEEVFRQLQANVDITWFVKDGDSLEADSVICQFHGNARAILTGERTAMNLVQTLCGTATQVAEYASLLKNSHTRLLDTRKTLPGLRYAQKYAVLCGGGHNHRIGLYDAFLIKENHILACGSISKAVAQAKKQHPGKPVEVEVENLAELEEAIAVQTDIIMLDNFSYDDIGAAVAIAAGRAKLEVSGNITNKHLETLSTMGIDYISSGAITKHVKAIDLSLRVDSE